MDDVEIIKGFLGILLFYSIWYGGKRVIGELDGCGKTSMQNLSEIELKLRKKIVESSEEETKTDEYNTLKEVFETVKGGNNYYQGLLQDPENQISLVLTRIRATMDEMSINKYMKKHNISLD